MFSIKSDLFEQSGKGGLNYSKLLREIGTRRFWFLSLDD